MNVEFMTVDTLESSINLASTTNTLLFFNDALRLGGTVGVLSLLALRSHIGKTL